MKAIGLLRVSSEAQAGADRMGLPAQRRLCERVAQQNGLVIEEWVELAGVSGASVLEDPAFQKMLRRLADPLVAGIVVAELSRLMRPEKLSDYEILEAFRAAGKILYTPEGQRDVRTFGGRMLSMLQSELAAYERTQIAERTRRGREEKRRLGRRAEGPVGMPRGVAFDAESGTWSYVYPEADRVRQAFELYLGGVENLREIGRRTGIGVDTTDKSSSILRVLRQPLYMGVYRVDRRWSKGHATARESHELLELRVIDPPLVSPADFARVQERLAVRRERHPLRKDESGKPGTYGGHLECALCGAALVQRPSGSGHFAYLCWRPRQRCATGTLSIRKADLALDVELEELLGSTENLRGLLRATLEHHAGTGVAQPASLERRISELENKVARAKDAYLAGAFTVRDLQKRTGDIEDEIRELRALQDRVGSAIDLTPDSLVAVARSFASWCGLPRAAKRSLLESWGVRIAVSKRGAGKSARFHVERLELGSLGGVSLYNYRGTLPRDPEGE